MAPQVQQTLGRYRIVGELGRGAMGAVYRAVDPLIERDVALKTLLPTLPAEIMAEVRERFLREARSAGRLNHPNIVTIYDVGEHEGVAYIAMELLEGRSLQEILRGGERLPFATIADLAAQVADALDHAQRFSIVHRDVKPANIMVDAWGRAKLTDFGVAHLPSSSMTQTGATLGSPRYMSPEQVLGVAADPRADLFSLGVVLYEMLCGRNPFQRTTDSVFSLMHRVAGEPHLPLEDPQREIPPGFAAIVERALAKKPEARYQRAAEMASDLRNYRGQGSGGHTRTLVAGTAPRVTQSSPAPQPKVDEGLRTQLLTDLDKFVENFDREEQAKLREEEQARLRKAEELRLWQPPAAAAEARKPDAQRHSRSPVPAAQPPRQDSAAARAKAIAALDHALRQADRYLSEIVGQINSVHPQTEGPYDFPYLGRVPSVSLSKAFLYRKPTRVDGKEINGEVKLSYRAAPSLPHVARLQGEEIARCTGYLKSLNVEHKALAEQRNDSAQPAGAQITVTGSLPCEVVIRADYERSSATLELSGVRRIGRFTGEAPAGVLEAAVDDLVRYILGVDVALERLLRRAG
jgi:serine/threonine protein kinase